MPNLTPTTPAATASPTGTQRAPRPAKAYTDFEASLIAVLMEAALPHGPATFGKGLPGQMARSELARQLGATLAARGTLGLAARISGKP